MVNVYLRRCEVKASFSQNTFIQCPFSAFFLEVFTKLPQCSIYLSVGNCIDECVPRLVENYEEQHLAW